MRPLQMIPPALACPPPPLKKEGFNRHGKVEFDNISKGMAHCGLGWRLDRFLLGFGGFVVFHVVSL